MWVHTHTYIRGYGWAGTHFNAHIHTHFWQQVADTSPNWQQSWLAQIAAWFPSISPSLPSSLSPTHPLSSKRTLFWGSFLWVIWYSVWCDQQPLYVHYWCSGIVFRRGVQLCPSLQLKQWTDVDTHIRTPYETMWITGNEKTIILLCLQGQTPQKHAFPQMWGRLLAFGFTA